jgi:integrase
MRFDHFELGIPEALIVLRWVRQPMKALKPALSLHSLRHTFSSWRLEMGEPMIQVQSLMGHADANTLLHYAHVQVDPMADLLPLL